MLRGAGSGQEVGDRGGDLCLAQNSGSAAGGETSGGAGGQPHELSKADLQVLGLVAMGGGWSATFGDELESAGHFHPEAERLRAELRRQVPALGCSRH